LFDHLEPIIAAPGAVRAVTHLGDDALELAGLLVRLATFDLEALAELDICIGDNCAVADPDILADSRPTPEIGWDGSDPV
jgi:hypothetical protein